MLGSRGSYEKTNQNPEQEFTNLVRAYRKHHIGKGPEQVKVTFRDRWAIVNMKGSLNPVERFIAQTNDEKHRAFMMENRCAKFFMPWILGRFAPTLTESYKFD